MATFARSLASTALSIAAVGLLGCPSPTPCNLAADGVCASGCPTDPDCVNTDAGQVDAGTTRACSDVPTNNFGTSVGRNFSGFTLQQCDGTDFTFYNDQFCEPDHTLTVLSIAAEWCGPCRMESAQLSSRIVEPYGPRGVRVVQAIVQNISYGPPTLDLCNRWVGLYGLEGVTEVIDPEGVTNPFFPSGSLPSTVIIDERGVIVYAEDGVSSNLVALTTALDRELTRLGR